MYGFNGRILILMVSFFTASVAIEITLVAIAFKSQTGA